MIASKFLTLECVYEIVSRENFNAHFVLELLCAKVAEISNNQIYAEKLLNLSFALVMKDKSSLVELSWFRFVQSFGRCTRLTKMFTKILSKRPGSTCPPALRTKFLALLNQQPLSENIIEKLIRREEIKEPPTSEVEELEPEVKRVKLDATTSESCQMLPPDEITTTLFRPISPDNGSGDSVDTDVTIQRIVAQIQCGVKSLEEKATIPRSIEPQLLQIQSDINVLVNRHFTKREA
jgi:hypothetical protein